MRRMLVDMSRDGPNPAPEDLKVTEFSRRTVVTVLTDPGTLRPVEAGTETRVRVGIEGEGEAKEQREDRRYTFAWE